MDLNGQPILSVLHYILNKKVIVCPQGFFDAVAQPPPPVRPFGHVAWTPLPSRPELYTRPPIGAYWPPAC